MQPLRARADDGDAAGVDALDAAADAERRAVPPRVGSRRHAGHDGAAAAIPGAAGRSGEGVERSAARRASSRK